MAQPSRARRRAARVDGQGLSRRRTQSHGAARVTERDRDEASASWRRPRDAALELVARQPDVVRGRGLRGGQLHRSPGSTTPRTFPCNGVEEPKSAESYGLGIQAVFDAPDGRRLGFGSEPSDLTARGRRARARQGARGRPSPIPSSSRCRAPARRARARSWTTTIPRLMDARRRRAWSRPAGRSSSGALAHVLTASSRWPSWRADDEGLRRLGLILGGDVTILQERIAIASTHDAARPDRRVHADHRVRRRPWWRPAAPRARAASTGTRLDHFTDEAGVDAAQNADQRDRAASACPRAPTRSSSAASRWPTC